VEPKVRAKNEDSSLEIPPLEKVEPKVRAKN